MKMIRRGCIETNDWKAVVQCTGFGHIGKRNPCGSALEINLDDICRVYRWRDGRLIETLGFFCCECHQFTTIMKIDLPKPFREFYFTPVVESEPGIELSRNLTLDERKKSDELKKYL